MVEKKEGIKEEVKKRDAAVKKSVKKVTEASEELQELAEEAKKMGEVTKESSEETVEKKELPQRIYVGPNLLELQKYTVMEDGFTPHVEELIKKCPSIKKLFVPIKSMALTEERAGTRGTLEHRHFNKIITYASGKGE